MGVLEVYHLTSKNSPAFTKWNSNISKNDHNTIIRLYSPKGTKFQLLHRKITAVVSQDSAAGGHYDRLKELKDFDESKMGVKGLSDSGITSLPRIFVHPPEWLSDLKKTSDSEALSIPLIDLSGINSPSVRPQIVEQVKEASKTWGFFQVINHGIPTPVMDRTIESVKAFHDLPHEVKSKYYSRTPKPRAATLLSNFDLFDSPVAGWQDTLRAMVGTAVPPEEVEFPEVCRAEAVEWISRSSAVADSLLEVLAEGLGLERGRFKDLSYAEKKSFGGHCYPYCPEPDRTIGVASHTDGVVLTVLMTNHVPGLQVKHGEVWVDVKPLHGSLIVNVGDFLEVASNGEYTSVQHRVLANSSKEPRITVGMFFGVEKWNDNGYFGPLPELLSPENPAKYRDFTKEEFYEIYLNKPIRNKPLIEKVRI